MNPLTYTPTGADVLIAVLATWRLAALLCYEERFEWLRQKAKVDFVDPETGIPITRMGRILSCFWCCSLYVAPLVVVTMIFNMRWLLIVLAASGGSIILQHWSRLHRYVDPEH